MCIFENDTVKSDCPMQENYPIFKDLTVCSGNIKINVEKLKSSENGQSTGHFQSFFSVFFSAPTLNLKKIPVDHLIKNNLALCLAHLIRF